MTPPRNTCPACLGTGTIHKQQLTKHGYKPTPEPCPTCKATGAIK